MSTDTKHNIYSHLKLVAPHPKTGQRLHYPQPPGSADAWLLAAMARQSKQTIVVLTAEPLQAQRLLQEISLVDHDLRVRTLPDWETLPYDGFSPHQDLVSERLRTLYALTQNDVDVLTVPITTAQYRLAPRPFLAAYTFDFKQKDRLDEAALREQLMLSNYSHVSQVTAPGEFSLRGGLVDLFPMGSAVPYRLDLFDDEIESIRAFDVDTQRTLYPVHSVQLLPGREFPLDETSRNQFRSRFREVFEGDPSRAQLYKDVGNGIAFAGIEYYLPLFFEETATLFDYLKPNTLIVSSGDLESAMLQFMRDTVNRYEFLKHDLERPVLPPEALFLKPEAVFEQLKPFARLALTAPSAKAPNLDINVSQASKQTPEVNERQPSLKHPDFHTAPDIAINRRSEDPVSKLRAVIHAARTNPDAPRLALCADSHGRRETLVQMLAEHQLVPDNSAEQISDFLQHDARFAVLVAPFDAGFEAYADDLIIVTENDLYPGHAGATRRLKRDQGRTTDIHAMVRDLAELRAGDPIVHAQYGIGRYHGLVNLDLGDGEMEFLHLEYAGKSTLYVPVSQLHVIARYSGADPDSAPLHQLGSGQWDKARKKAAQQVRDTAAELLDLYAKRAARQGYAFSNPLGDYELFAEGFGFEETPDQQAAIEAVIQDMTSGRPMDRLVCGDVGFGKTEVALRAAFIAVTNGYQVALLCPTTLLAEQHAQTFSDRFADWPIKVVELSRFRSAKEISQAITGITAGTVDIVIGTHKILSKDVAFKKLGLVIIDEEHRFGVRQKEALKAMRAEVDVLTLTATPIPRTLGMSLEGIRDFSIIATAPQKRLSIKTFVRREDNSTIREALLRELKRGGQAYFLHNEVDTIENRRARLAELVPEARIAVAHGQMGERELEQVMKGFYQQRFNVLLCTTIIETGIDVPTANTIIMHRADKFGLGQLHQLRGRVGRSPHQAYAYLLTPGEDAITKNARKRFEAIQAMEDLGAGFFLAMHDLEIRGTGEVLGESQSGNIQEVGFSMYNDMLNEAIRALKIGETPDLDAPFTAGCEVNLHAPALLPTVYCPDINARLALYKRLSNCTEIDALIQIQEELVDRFGKLPDPARVLLSTHRLRLDAIPLGIQKIDATDTQVLIQFKSNSPVEPALLIELIQTQKNMRFAGPDRLRIDIAVTDIKERTDAIRAFLRRLQPAQILQQKEPA